MTARAALARVDATFAARLGRFGWLLTALGGLLAAAGTLLPWAYDPSFGGNLTYAFYPG